MSDVTSHVYSALVHYPVRDREGSIVTTAITNLDVHDLARSSRTYDLRGYFVVSPIAAQRVLVERILDHWRHGAGARRVPERGVALALCEPIASVEEAIAAIAEREGARPRVVATAARPIDGVSVRSFAEEAKALREATAPTIVLFGTGHGLADALVREADVLLEPIHGGGDYNHLSVRAAAAIVFDRLLGSR